MYIANCTAMDDQLCIRKLRGGGGGRERERERVRVRVREREITFYSHCSSKILSKKAPL